MALSYKKSLYNCCNKKSVFSLIVVYVHKVCTLYILYRESSIREDINPNGIYTQTMESYLFSFASEGVKKSVPLRVYRSVLVLASGTRLIDLIP